MKAKKSQRPRPISLAPLSVDEVLAALLRTPPPPAEVPGTRKTVKKKRKKGAKR
jgi:hypothetical protein